MDLEIQGYWPKKKRKEKKRVGRIKKSQDLKGSI